MRLRFTPIVAARSLAILICAAGCSAASGSEPDNTGGSAAGGKSGSGGSAGMGTGGSQPGAGGSASGGKSNGGSSNGGSNSNGGSSSGGSSNGGSHSNSGGANNNSGGRGGAGGSSNGGSSSGGSSGNQPEASWATVRLVLTGTMPPCGSAPCHGAGGMAPPGNHLTLQDDDQLYTHVTTYTSKACGNVPLVDKSNPANSGLIKILKGPCGETPRMPYACSPTDGSCVPDEYINAIQQWIAKGAPK
ncbi:MAG: hypothetical protein ACOY0T_13505 [Myxococcota bacterium]